MVAIKGGVPFLTHQNNLEPSPTRLAPFASLPILDYNPYQ
jgi:hypothetical protein